MEKEYKDEQKQTEVSKCRKPAQTLKRVSDWIQDGEHCHPTIKRSMSLAEVSHSCDM